MRAAARLLLGSTALALVLLLGDARPAAADNCSGLSDCYFVSRSAVTVTVGVGTVAVVLLLTPPVTGSPDVKPLDPGDVPSSSPPPQSGGGPPGTSAVDPPPKTVPGGHGPPDQVRVKVAAADGTVVDRPVTPRHTAEQEVAIRTKVREADRAVNHLPRSQQKVLFAEEALDLGRDRELKALTAAIRRGAPPEEWIRAVNPTGDRTNVLAAVNAVDAALDKVPRIAKRAGALSAEAVARAHDSVVTQTTDLHDVGHFLAKAGPGARGVVTVQMQLPVGWANAVPVSIGHAFNGGNLDGRVVFLDPQTGVVAATPHEILVASGHDPATVVWVQFVPTHPRFS